MSKVVKQVKHEILSETAEGPLVDVNMFGNMRLTPPSGSFDGTKFLIGYISLPTVINFGAKLADAGVLFPQVDAIYTRGGAVIVTLAAHLLTGGKSFLLGSLLGQLPMVMDDLANVAVTAIKRRQIAPQLPQAAVKGIGDVDQQVLELRDQLNRVQMRGTPGNGRAMATASNRASFH